MALSVKHVTLWRSVVPNEPGVLAHALEPLAGAGADLRVVMGYRFPEEPGRAAIEIYPVTGKRAAAAAESAGLAPADIPCLLVEGDNRPGLGAALARGLADAGINIAFLAAQVIGRRFSAILGFADEATATAATRAVRAATARAGGKKKRRR